MMLRQLRLLVIFHQLLCHGSWALRPPPTDSTLLLKEASQPQQLNLTEDRLQQSQSQQLNALPRTATSSSSSLTPGNQIVSIHTNCTRDLYEIQINLSHKFRGILFAKDFVEECRTRGNQANEVTLRIPTSGCGVRSEMRPDGDLELAVKVMLQMDGKLRQRSDIETVVKCKVPPKLMMVDIGDGGEMMKKSARNGRMRFDHTTQANTSPPRVRVWLELGGSEGKGSVEVGEATTLSVRAVVPRFIGIRVIDCAALDGLGETSQKLLDERGCPIDEQVMPALRARYRPTEDGWSKPHDEDLVEQLFTATFPAFKFPDRERLHVSCGVQLCKGKCPEVNCQNGELFHLSTDRQLARIEVFNSLAVTAPQIEIDRLRSDRRYNMSVEEYPPKVTPLRAEGTLCLSISKLAIAFCILGLIFLIAVVIAVCCLIRSRSRRNMEPLRASSTSMFSTSTDSQSRFGSKLLIPYAGGSLPYGRVY